MAQPATNPKIEELRFRLKTDPKSRLFFPLAEELRKAGQLPEAEQVLRAGLGVHPTYLSAWVSLGRILHELKNDSGAVDSLTKALQLDPGNVVAARLLADSYLGLGETLEALKKYKLVHALLPADEELQAVIARLERELNPPSVNLSEPEPQPEPEPEPGPEPAPQPQREPGPEPVPQREPLPEPEPQREPEPDPFAPEASIAEERSPFGDEEPAESSAEEPFAAAPEPLQFPRATPEAAEQPDARESLFAAPAASPFAAESPFAADSPFAEPETAAPEAPLTTPESPFAAAESPFAAAADSLLNETRAEEETGDVEPMSSAHSESPFEEPVASYTSAALDLEGAGGFHIDAAPLAAEVPTPVDELVAPEEEADVFAPAPATETPASDITDTLTMADLYVRQGLLDDARKIYEHILARDPENAVVREKLETLDRPAPASNAGKVARLENWLARVKKEAGRV